MKTILKQGLAMLLGIAILYFTHRDHRPENSSGVMMAGITECYSPEGCVFKTIFGEESSENASENISPEEINQSMDYGLRWLAQAQVANQGWGAGSHQRQDVFDPHAVQSDPATTAMAGMAFLRSGSTLNSGPYAAQVKNALHYLLRSVENTPDDRLKITELSGTQIQTKLGDNIDAVLAMQFFANILDQLENHELKARVASATEICADKLEKLQDADGSIRGSGWAGVLQSALANNALESAAAQGVPIDEEVMTRSREYQKGNYDPATGDVDTAKGAGIMLYSVSGTVRASAVEARKVREEIKKAKDDGRLKENDEVSAESLEKIGYDSDAAMRYSTSYNVYESAKRTAQRSDVMEGFGNNGGEEFLSYLQTGESLIINQDNEWKKWYGDISGRLVSIQNNDGSWQGHHCITSPVFCTATTLLTLSINNDIDKLIALGQPQD